MTRASRVSLENDDLPLPGDVGCLRPDGGQLGIGWGTPSSEDRILGVPDSHTPDVPGIPPSQMNLQHAAARSINDSQPLPVIIESPDVRSEILNPRWAAEESVEAIARSKQRHPHNRWRRVSSFPGEPPLLRQRSCDARDGDGEETNGPLCAMR